MVVIPSGTSLGKRKLRQAADSTRAMLALRTQLVSQMLGRGEVRGRHAFDTTPGTHRSADWLTPCSPRAVLP